MEKKLYELSISEKLDKALPPLTEGELSLLTESILTEGCREPIVVFNGTVIDGHNRYRICREHNIPFAITEMEFDDEDDDQIIASTNSDKGEILFKYLKLSYQARIISRWKETVINRMVSDHYIEKGRFSLRSRGEEDSPRPIMESFHKIVMKGHQAGSSLLEFKENLNRSVGTAVQKVGSTFAVIRDSIDRSVGSATQKIEPAHVNPSIGAGLQKMIPSVLELKKKLDQSVGAALQKFHEFTSSDAYEEWKKEWVEEEGIDEDEDLFGIAPEKNDTGIPD